MARIQLTGRWFCLVTMAIIGINPLGAQDAGSRELLNLLPGPVESRSLPTPTGQFQVGTAAYHLVDTTRRETASADPDDLRQVIMQLWYPTTDAAGYPPAVYFPELSATRGALRSHTESLPHRIAEDLVVLAGVKTHSVVAPPVADTEGRGFPVVIFSPGGNMSRRYHTALMEELASHGYIAVAVSHAYVGWDVFPAGGFIKSIDWGLNVESDSAAADAEDRLALILVDDVRLVLAELAFLDANGRFAQAMNLGRVALMGHSRGVLTVARGCELIRTIRTCIAMDVIGPDHGAQLDVPWLTLRRADWDSARVETLRRFLKGNISGAWVGSVRGASHFTFSDLPLVDPEHYPTEIDPEYGHRIVATAVLEFLDRTLRSSAGVTRLDDALTGIPELELEFVRPERP